MNYRKLPELPEPPTVAVTLVSYRKLPELPEPPTIAVTLVSYRKLPEQRISFEFPSCPSDD